MKVPKNKKLIPAKDYKVLYFKTKFWKLSVQRINSLTILKGFKKIVSVQIFSNYNLDYDDINFGVDECLGDLKKSATFIVCSSDSD